MALFTKYLLPWKNSIYLKFLLLFILILTPIYVIGLNIYYWGADAVEEQVYQSVDAQMNYYLDTMEADVEQIKILMLDALNDFNLNYLATISPVMRPFDKQRAITQLQQRMITIRSSNEWISDVTVYIPGTRIQVSAENGYGELAAEAVQSYLNHPHRFTRAPVQEDGGDLLLRVSSPNNANRPAQFVIETRLSASALADSLDYLTRYDSGEEILLRRTVDNAIVASSGGESYGERWMPANEGGRAFIQTEKKELFVVYASSSELELGLVRYVDSSLFMGQFDTYRKWFWFFSLTATLLVVLFSWILYKLIHKPLITLLRAFRRLREGDLQVRIYRRPKDDFNYLYEHFNDTVQHLHSLIDQVYRQKILVQRAELKQLQAQINPHFLYNSFFMLHRMIKLEDQDNALSFSKNLGQYFQYITRNTTDDILLIREAEHASVYMELQGMRLGNRMSLHMESSPQAINHIYVPRLILQPLIENAIEHGLSQTETGGVVEVRFREDEQYWRIEVRDNGCGMDGEQLETVRRQLSDEGGEDYEITALINIHRRIRIYCGEGSGLRILKADPGDFVVQIALAKEG
ncbi:hypothetical protein B1748_28015 [Paenibacillus sp. MY03]|nr:hypothetical protein B1748_28015 [Paenibacillus sp. MY03]